MITLTHIAAFRDTDTLEKARHGRYADTAKNRRLHRVGQEYGSKKQEDPESVKKPQAQQETEQPKKERNGDSVKRELELLEEHKDSIVEKYGEKAYNKKVESLKKEGEDFEQKETVKELKKRADKKDAEKATRIEIKYNDHFNLDYDNIKEINDFPYNFIHSVLNDLQESGVQPNELKIGHKFRTNPGEAMDKMRSMAQNLLYDLGPDFSGKDRERAKEVIEAAIWAKTFYSNEKIEDTEKAAQEKKQEDNAPQTVAKENKEGNKVTTPERTARIKFDDMPNSGKVKLQKYLSKKMQAVADDTVDNIVSLGDKAIKEHHDSMVTLFNNKFDDLSKSERAKLLYQVMKLKNAMAKK